MSGSWGSDTTPCANPGHCGVSAHVRHSFAATRCRMLGKSARTPMPSVAPPPPPPWSEVHAQAMEAGGDEVMSAAQSHNKAERAHRMQSALGALLEDQDRASGWQAGTVHPTGGYDDRVVEIAEKYATSWGGYESALVVRYTRAGVSHRGDGPATVVYEHHHEAGVAELEQVWSTDGQVHRADGPARIANHNENNGAHETYHLDGVMVHEDSRGPANAARARVGALLEWGADRQEVVCWLGYEAAAGKKATKALIRAGVSGTTAYECARAGLTDPGAVRSVALDGVPMSWAGAGL